MNNYLNCISGAAISWAVILALLAPGTVCRAAGAVPAGSVSGVIVDPDGKPVADASVFLDDYDYDAHAYRPLAKTASGRDGSFRLGSQAPEFRNRKDLRIIAPGYAPAAVPGATFSIFAGADHPLGTIRLRRGQVLTGQVVDSDGKPLGGATVECEAARYVTDAFGHPLTPTYRMTTDAEGRFVTPSLPVSVAGITVRVPGRLMPWVRVPVGPGGRVELAPIRLRKCEPIVGRVVDERGHGVAGAKIYASGWEFGTSWLLFQRGVTDARGRFMLDGLGRRIQLLISSPDHVGINRILRGGKDGLYWAESRGWDGDARRLKGPVSELQFTMDSVAWIEGRAIDADTGKPVQLSKIVRCSFDRKPNAEVVLNGCQSTEFDQDADGVYRVQYSVPDEYHLTLSAAGYQDGEAFTPPVTRLQPVTGIVVKMHRLKHGGQPQIVRQRLCGTVTRDGQAAPTGWVVLTKIAQQPDKPNVAIWRGRTLPTEGGPFATAAIYKGKYSLDVPYQSDDWLIEAEVPDGPITQICNVSVPPNENRKLDINIVHGGGISGRVDDIPMQWKDETWVVAFARTGLRFEALVGADGTFTFGQLPPGEYGLKAGHDAFLDAERPAPMLADDDPAYGSPGEPWKRAKIVIVEPDRTTRNVRLELPAN